MDTLQEKTGRLADAGYGPFPGRELGPANEFEPFPPEDVEEGIPHRFEKIAARCGERVALSDGAESLTYNELNRRANRLARAVLERDPDRSRALALFLGQGNGAVVALMAALKAGKMYVALDSRYPRSRIEYLLADSGAGLCLTSLAETETLEALLPDGFPLVRAADVGTDLSESNLELPVDAGTPAALNYTSGSTGDPKGVLVTHRNSLHAKMVSINSYHLSKEDRIGQLASFSFSAAASYVLSPLLVGATCLSFDVRAQGLTALADWLQRERITVTHMVPTLFRSFAAAVGEGRTFPDIRVLSLGGETVLPRDLDLFQRLFSEAALLRITFAMTETGCAVTRVYFGARSAVPRDVMPAGYDLPDVEALIWDENGNTVAPGEVGEIVVRSRYLPPGYWRRPEMTARRYLPDPEGGDARVCLTGDLGMRTADGCLIHMGRKDSQVKVRGIRIETGEVEAALLALEDVANAVVVARDDGAGDKRLVAYMTVNEGAVRPLVSELRAHLAERLPAYMIPSAFGVLDALPMTTSGKVDRRALPDPEQVHVPRSTGYVAPRDMVERQIALLWQELLRVARVGATDNFWDLGGHSLLAGQLFVRIEQLYGRKLPLSTIMESATVEQLAAVIRQEDWQKAFCPIVPVKTGGSRRPFFCVAAMDAFAYVNLARCLDEEQPLYVLHPLGLMDGEGEDGPDVPVLATKYVELVRQVQPEGPYLLGGMCSGGVTAFEMAQQLVAQGERLDALILIDTPHFTRRTMFQRARWPAGRVLHHLHRALHQPAGPRLRYAMSKAGGLKRRLLGRGPAPREMEGQTAVVEAYWQPIREAYSGPLRNYEPKRYPGRVHLLIGAETPMGPWLDPRMKWRKLAGGGAQIRVVPGDHTDMLREPNVSALAREIDECLRRATAGAGTGPAL